MSHIENSEDNLRNLLNATETNQAPFDLVIVTASKTGPGGKVAAPKAFAPSGNYILIDDNLTTTHICENNHFRKPGQSLVVPPGRSGWSASDPQVIRRIENLLWTFH